MTTFNYKAINISNNKIQTGVIQAESKRQARQLLKNRGFIVESLVASDTKETYAKKIQFKKTISSLELTLITRQFAILLNSGLSVEQSLNALIEQLESLTQKNIMMGIRSEILNGHTLASAMRMYPKVFPSVYCSLIHAGEQSGSLANVMTKLADYSDKTRELTSKILMALLYPMIITIVAILMITALLVYVVPQVVKVFEASKQELPLLTKILIMTSHTLRSYGIYILLAIIMSGFVIYKMLQNHQYKIKGEFATAIKTEIQKAYPYPIFEGEKFCRESLVYRRIGKKYD